MDMFHCHPYHFLEIYKPPVNEPIGSYQIQHLMHSVHNQSIHLSAVMEFAFKSGENCLLSHSGGCSRTHVHFKECELFYKKMSIIMMRIKWKIPSSIPALSTMHKINPRNLMPLHPPYSQHE